MLTEAGHTVRIATPGGARPTVDAISLDERGGVDAADAAGFQAYLESIDTGPGGPRSTSPPRAADYEALYLPGGTPRWPTWPTTPASAPPLAEADHRGQVIAALCHGVAGLLSATKEDGTFVFAGRSLTGFTDEEEKQGGLGDQAPGWWRAGSPSAAPTSGPARPGPTP